MNQKQYHKYLRSPKWKAIRLQVIARDNNACTLCGRTSKLHAHHLHYDSIGNESLSDLVTLCKSCHFKETDKLDHPIFGKYSIVQTSGRHYTKVYHSIALDFSSDIFFKYWYRICQHLERNTNFIKNVRFVKDFGALCGSSPRNIYRFIKECKAKNLIARIMVDNQKYYVVNPYYALNGNKMPKVLHDLFNKPIEKYQLEYDKDQEAGDD